MTSKDYKKLATAFRDTKAIAENNREREIIKILQCEIEAICAEDNSRFDLIKFQEASR